MWLQIGIDRSDLGLERWLRVSLAVAALAYWAMAPAPLAAATVQVDCTGATPGAFTSINDAINTLTAPPPVDTWDFVLLKADCTENVVITGARRVWIAPEGSECPFSGCTPAGPPLRITAANASQDVVQISGPSEVTLVHLVLSGGNNGLHAERNANVTTYDVTADGNSGMGIALGTGSTLALNEGGATNNAKYGLLVGGGSGAVLTGQAPWLHEQPVVISGNQVVGIWVDRSFLSAGSGTFVQDNGGPGIVSYGGNLLWGAFIGETVVQNNRAAAFLAEGSQASFWRSGTGSTIFRNNATYGVYVEGNSDAAIFDVLVEGHPEVGVDVVMGSQVSLRGTRIRANGLAGVRVDGNSMVYMEQAQVTENQGPGVVVDLNSSVDARGTVVNANTREGFRVRHQSLLTLSEGGSFAPNAGPPVTCDLTSDVISATLAPRRACPKISRPTQPRPVRQNP